MVECGQPCPTIFSFLETEFERWRWSEVENDLENKSYINFIHKNIGCITTTIITNEITGFFIIDVSGWNQKMSSNSLHIVTTQREDKPETNHFN